MQKIAKACESKIGIGNLKGCESSLSPEKRENIFKPNSFFRGCALMVKAVAASYTALLRYSHQMHHDEPAKQKVHLNCIQIIETEPTGWGEPPPNVDHNTLELVPAVQRGALERLSGGIYINRSNISIKDKHFRVQQLLKEDAGSGVRADDSGVGVFIIFVNITNQHNCHPLHINHDHDQGDPPPLGRYQRPTRRGRLAPRLRRRSQLQR